MEISLKKRKISRRGRQDCNKHVIRGGMHKLSNPKLNSTTFKHESSHLLTLSINFHDFSIVFLSTIILGLSEKAPLTCPKNCTKGFDGGAGLVVLPVAILLFLVVLPRKWKIIHIPSMHRASDNLRSCKLVPRPKQNPNYIPERSPT